VVGDAAETRGCEACGHQQSVPVATAIDVVPGDASDEAARLARLREQLDHEWLMPESIARYGNVLEGELDEAREVWAKIRRRIEQGDESEGARVELLVMTMALYSGMPVTTDAERLSRRAVIEASAETLRDPAMRQRLLGNMVVGAIRARAASDARAWLARLDPKSERLDADSMYRLAAAMLATDAGDPARVVELLGRRYDDMPIHKSFQGMAAVLRAHALETLGSLEDAVSGLYDQIRRSHSALALMKTVVHNMPREWATCERSLPLAVARDHERLAKHVFLPRAWLGPVLVAAGALLAVASLSYESGRFWPGAGAGLALGMFALLVRRAQQRKRIAIIEGCKTVDGRILAVHPTADGKVDFEVVVERPGGGETRVTTRQSVARDILQMKIVGASFDAIWNPDYPEHFLRMTIHVAGDEIERVRGSEQ
jgi:hypothetical protein